MERAESAHLIKLTQQLLDCIAARDWATYERLCSDDLTCFEPESRGQLVKGLAFHWFYFDIETGRTRVQSTMCAPTVRLLSEDVAVVCYVRLVQWVNLDGEPETARSEETRVWHRVEGTWKHVHFHRSTCD